MNKQQQSEMATLIATAVTSAMAQYNALAGGSIVPTKTGGKLSRIVPQKSHPPRGNFGRDSDAVNPDVITLVVSDAKDNRLKLPKRLFDVRNKAVVNGETYHGSEADGGRAKVSPGVFDAEEGDTVEIVRNAKNSNQWTAIVLGQPKRRAPQAQAKAKLSPKSGKIAPRIATVKSNGGKQALETLLDKTAALAFAGFEAGRGDKSTLAETDARRYLTSRDKKAFNVQTNALKVALGDAVRMLNERVFEEA